MRDEGTGGNRSRVVVIVSVSSQGPRCISHLRYSRDCVHRVAPLIHESPRDYVRPRTIIGHCWCSFGDPVLLLRLRKLCGRSRPSPASREFFAARTYLSQTGGCFMVMGCAGDHAQIEAKTRLVGTYTRVPLGARKTWFTVRQGSVVQESSRLWPRKRPEQCPYLDPIPRRDVLREYIPTPRRECRRNCLLEVVVIRETPCRRRLQILYLVRINIFNLPHNGVNKIYLFFCLSIRWYIFIAIKEEIRIIVIN